MKVCAVRASAFRVTASYAIFLALLIADGASVVSNK